MGLEVQLEPIFGQLAVEKGAPPRQFLFHVHAPDSSHLRILVTDFHSNTWEVVRSVSQLEDMQDSIGIGGTWSEFIDYLVASIKSQDAKLVLEGHSNSDGNAAAKAKLVAQKSKGMPKIYIALTKVVGSAATEAIANLSLQLFKEFQNISASYVKEQERSMQLSKVITAEKERSDSIQSQLEQYSMGQKIQRVGSSDIAGFSNGTQNSTEKQATRVSKSTKVSNRVVPAYRRAKVRGAVLQDTEDEQK